MLAKSKERLLIDRVIKKRQRTDTKSEAMISMSNNNKKRATERINFIVPK